MNSNLKILSVGSLCNKVVTEFSSQVAFNITSKILATTTEVNTQFNHQISEFLGVDTRILILVLEGSQPKDFELFTQIAQQAKELEILTLFVGVVSYSKDPNKYSDSLQSFKKLSALVDASFIIDANQLNIIDKDASFENEPSNLEALLTKQLKGICQLAHFPDHTYVKESNLKDFKSLFSQSSHAIYTEGLARGADRAQVALQRAINNLIVAPQNIKQAKQVMIIMSTGSKELSLDEVGQINVGIIKITDEPNIIMGVREEDSLQDALKVQIIFTGTDWVGELLAKNKQLN